jgi:hypothetical protein
MNVSKPQALRMIFGHGGAVSNYLFLELGLSGLVEELADQGLVTQGGEGLGEIRLTENGFKAVAHDLLARSAIACRMTMPQESRSADKVELELRRMLDVVIHQLRHSPESFNLTSD